MYCSTGDNTWRLSLWEVAKHGVARYTNDPRHVDGKRQHYCKGRITVIDSGDEQKNSRTDNDIKAGDPNADEAPSAGSAETPRDEDMERIAADQTASTSENADKAGKDAEEDPPEAPAPR